MHRFAEADDASVGLDPSTTHLGVGVIRWFRLALSL